MSAPILVSSHAGLRKYPSIYNHGNHPRPFSRAGCWQCSRAAVQVEVFLRSYCPLPELIEFNVLFIFTAVSISISPEQLFNVFLDSYTPYHHVNIA
jgi:hypothetical protein